MKEWTPRVRRWRIRRLYNLSKIGVYDDELLLEVGWGLYTRGQDVLTVVRAVSGEVPCPKCGEIVYRAQFYRNLKQKQKSERPSTFACPECKLPITWFECREALRRVPRCFECVAHLVWAHEQGILSCPECTKTWYWQVYRHSIKNRIRLPCPHCSKIIHRPPTAKQTVSRSQESASQTSGELRCPSCKNQGNHISGLFRCPYCGYEKKWSIYTKRLKKKIEILKCTECNHEFTWQSWRQLYQNQNIFTGNPDPVKEFLKKWPMCVTPEHQMIEIDNLIYALHGKGILGPLFIQGSEEKVKVLLDELAWN